MILQGNFSFSNMNKIMIYAGKKKKKKKKIDKKKKKKKKKNLRSFLTIEYKNCLNQIQNIYISMTHSRSFSWYL